MTARETRHVQFDLETERINAVVARAHKAGTIGVPQHPEPSTTMQFVAQWEEAIGAQYLA